MSIGWNPYFHNSDKTIETWILHDFDKDFYGEELSLAIIGYIRPEASFPSVESLIEDSRRWKNSRERPWCTNIRLLQGLAILEKGSKLLNTLNGWKKLPYIYLLCMNGNYICHKWKQTLVYRTVPNFMVRPASINEFGNLAMSLEYHCIKTSNLLLHVDICRSGSVAPTYQQQQATELTDVF